MNHKVVSKELIERSLTDEFEEAEIFSAETEHLLNEVERYFANDLTSKGIHVRFNDLHILAKGKSNTVFSHLRANLPVET